MPKLALTATAGFNAGKTFYAKPVKVSDIVIDPEISEIFSIQDKTLEGIREQMEKIGYDKSQPVVIIKGKNILVDGHTRLAAARKAGLEEVPAVEMEFKDRKEAILYTFGRQALRRNLKGSEVMKAARMILKKQGGAQEIMELLGVSRATAYQAIKVLKEGTKEEVKAVENGDKSMKKAYAVTAGNNPQRPRKPEASSGLAEARQAQLPDSAAFLKGAVILLIEAGLQEAACLLVSHFLRKNEREAFFGLLPEQVRKHLVDSTGGIYQ